MSSVARPEGLGVYLHVPYCRARCTYCAFYTLADEGPAAQRRFAGALARAGERVAGAGHPPLFGPLGGRLVETVYFGGGTPSLLAADVLAALLERLRQLFVLTADAEITLEANPETVTREAARAWVAAGFTRISLGAQTFDAALLSRLGREHAPETIDRAVALLRDAGCRSLSLDLIAGVNPAGLEDDLDRACALVPDHLSVYLLELDAEEVGGRTALAAQAARGGWQAPDEDWFADAYPLIVERLRAVGLPRYEICNFARPGHASRHNLRYWRREEVLGLGPAAHSLLGGRRFAAPSDVRAWIGALDAGRDPELIEDRGVDPQAEALMLGLRLDEGVSWSEVERRAGAPARPAQLQAIDALCDEGLLGAAEGRLRLTARGVLLSNEVFQRLLD